METMHADKAWGELRSAVTRCRAGESWQALSDELGGGLEVVIATACRSSDDQAVLTYIHKALGYLPVMRWGAPLTAVVYEHTIYGLNTALAGFITGKTRVCHVEPSKFAQALAARRIQCRLLELFKTLGANERACDFLLAEMGRSKDQDWIRYRVHDPNVEYYLENVRSDLVQPLRPLVGLIQAKTLTLEDVDRALPKDLSQRFFVAPRAVYMSASDNLNELPATKVYTFAEVREMIVRIIHEECVKVIAPGLQWAYDLAPTVPHPHLEGARP